MTMKTILCPIDFSESSDAAVDLAVAAAKWLRARLVLFHVDPPPTQLARLLSKKAHEELRREHAWWLESRMASARERLGSGPDIESLSRIVNGDPGDQIVQVAADLDTALIVMSSHSSLLRRTVLGSVAEKVAEMAPCPVLLTRGDDPVRVPFAKPVVCTDFSPLSERLFERVKVLSSADATVELLHVVDEPAVAALNASLARRHDVLDALDALHDEAKARLADYARTLAHEELTIRETVIGGPIASTILLHASQSKASVIAVGSHAPVGLRQRVLGTVAARVLHLAEVPVLLCPGSA